MADKTPKKRDDTGGKGLQAYSAGPKKRDETGSKGNQAYDVVAGPGGKGNLAYPVKGKK